MTYGPPPPPVSRSVHTPPPPSGSPVAPVSGPSAPAPPRGPGVRVPFLAPPKDRNNTRIAVTIVVGVLVLIVCGVGGLFGAGSLVSWLNRDMNDKAVTAADTFLAATTTGDFDGAYAQLCEPLRQKVSAERFASEWSAITPTGTVYGITALTVDSDGYQYVPVVLTPPGAPQGRELDLYMNLEPARDENDKASMSVCGWQVRG